MVEKNTSNRNIDIFQDLNMDKNRKRYTAGKAPDKPVLLLSIIVLYKNDRIDLRHIESNLDLRETWSEFWECLEYESKGPIYLPFYHMRSDGFWNIEFSQDITPHQPKSLRSLNEIVEEVSLDEELIELIDDKDSREVLVNALFI